MNCFSSESNGYIGTLHVYAHTELELNDEGEFAEVTSRKPVSSHLNNN